jgi:hypothetical protein
LVDLLSSYISMALLRYSTACPNPDKPEPNRLTQRGKVAQQDGAKA